ncbi:phosphohistidine phosphatase SixA [Marinomonas epiphytica]
MKKAKTLFILRHGEAEPYGFDVEDEKRRLTDFGRREVSSVAQQFEVQGVKLDAVVVSPYIRAQQTAEAFIKQQGLELHYLTSDLITPDGQEHLVADYLQNLPYARILLVTHQPFAHQFVDYLVDQPLPRQFAMTTATLAVVNLDVVAMACGQFSGSLSPNVEY